MIKASKSPTTLLEAVRYFADPDQAHAFMSQIRWPNGATCPRCGHGEASFLSTRRIWKCKGCKRQFSVKVGTVFEDSPLGLDKWLPALWMLANCKNGISSYELARALGVTQKTAWFMLHRIRLAMQAKSFDRTGFQPLKGEVEIDETFIGGKASNMHLAKRERVMGGKGRRARPSGSKTAVMGMLQRSTEAEASKVQAHVVPSVRRTKLQHIAVNSVEPGAEDFTDALPSYNRLGSLYQHHVINHAYEYVRGRVHTNGIENFWSLLKRTIKGTYVAIDPFHLKAYVDVQVFRFNNREGKDGDRFVEVARMILGKRLTYEKLIGNDLAPGTT